MLLLEEYLLKKKMFEMESFLLGEDVLFSLKELETKDYSCYCFYFISICCHASVEIASGVYGQSFLC